MLTTSRNQGDGKLRFRIAIIARIILLASIVAGCSAVSITISPDAIEAGDQITITMKDLPDDTSFAILVEGSFDVGSGEQFMFEVGNFQMPISLSGGWISASTQNTVYTTLATYINGNTINVGGPSKNGVFTFTRQEDIPAGNYDYFRLNGQAMPDATEVVAQLRLTGTKTGPSASQITFIVNGVGDGSSRIVVSVDGKDAFEKTIPIGEGSPTTEPTTEPTGTVTTSPTTTTTTSPGSSGGSSSGGSDGGSSISSTTTSPEGGAVIWSDGLGACIDGCTLENVTLVETDAVNVPEGWQVVGKPISVTPEGAVFPGSAILRFALPEDLRSSSALVFVAAYISDKWQILPSTIEESMVCTEIAGGGIFCPMRFADAGTIDVTTASQAGTTDTETATTAAQQQPMGLAAGLIGLLVAALLVGRGRK